MDNVDGSTSPCISLLTDEVIEITLASLPISDLFNAALVCKEWLSFIASSHFLRAASYSFHASKPWLFVLGQSRSLLSAKTRVTGFDPLAWRWNLIALPASIDSKKLELEPARSNITMNVEEGNGILFYPAGRRIKYSLSFLNPKCKWEESPPMSCWRHQQPVVCYLAGGATSSFNRHIFVVGGVCDFEEGNSEIDDQFRAEMLDLNSGVWELLDPLPSQFKASASATWLSCAVSNDRIYLLERYSGDCCYFDLQRKHWELVGKLLRPHPPPSSSSLVDEEQLGGLILLSANSKKGLGLLVGGLWRDDGGIMSFRVWSFNNIVCREMGRMPPDMYNLVTGKAEEEEEGCRELVTVKCKGMEDLIYIYSDRSEHICVCDISGHGQLFWRMLPNRTCNYNYSSRFKYVCSPVTLDQISL